MSRRVPVAHTPGCDEAHPLLAEVRLAVARAAAAWRDCGVEAGEAVAIGLGDSAEFIVACLGAAAAGAVPVALDPLAPGEHLLRVWAQDRCRFILLDSREGRPDSLRDFVLTSAEWREALREAVPLDFAVQPVSA